MTFKRRPLTGASLAFEGTYHHATLLDDTRARRSDDPRATTIMTAPRPPSERSQRRAAERARQKSRPEAGLTSSWVRSPILWLSAAGVAVGLALVIVVAIAAGSSGTAAIQTPIIGQRADLEDGRAFGRGSALITIDEWADFQCPVCERFYTSIEPRLRASYIQAGTVRLIFHDLAFIGPESVDAAAAARVSEAIGPGFWPFHDLLYSNQGKENGGAFSRDRLADMAVSLGMDRAAFLAALDDPAYPTAVEVETSQGAQLGVHSTPTLVVDGALYPGLPTWDQLSALIEQVAGTVHASPRP